MATLETHRATASRSTPQAAQPTGTGAPPRTSHLAHLPTPALNRTSSHRSTHGSTSISNQYAFNLDVPLHDDPASSARFRGPPGSTLAFSRQGSSESFRQPSPTSSTYAPLPSPGVPPTWPNPASYSFSPSPPSKTVPSTEWAKIQSSPSKPPTTRSTAMPSKSSNLSSTTLRTSRPSGGAKLICFELALGNRLAAALDRGTTLQSIREASGLISTDIVEEGEPGTKKLECVGSASSVHKARQLVDVKLSQTPILNLVALDIPPSTSSLAFVRPDETCAITHSSDGSYRLVTSSLSPTHESSLSKPFLRRPILESHPSTTSIISAFSLPPSQTSAANTPECPNTPSSESAEIYFDASTSPLPSLAGSPPPNSPAAHGPFAGSINQEAEAVRAHVGDSVERSRPEDNSVASVRRSASTSYDVPKIGNFRTRREEYISALVDELEVAVKKRSLVRVKVDVGNQEWKKATPESIRGDEISKGHQGSGDLDFQNERWSLEDVERWKGQDLRNVPKGGTASGTLVLKKCSTLPSKPFALSIVSLDSATACNPQEGRDLQVKILADKAATSPSLDLSAAMQSATWDLDTRGLFHVSVELNEERFGKGETEIKWVSRERWENEDESLRFTLYEIRYSDTTRHERSIELSSPVLNRLLADCALDYAQGRSTKFERDKVRVVVNRLVEFGEMLVQKKDDDEDA
ncbi:hypothetical protein JCM10212_000057 [Sporobolomyces blumeae]